MLVEAAWEAMRSLPVTDFTAAFGTGPVLVLAPHPDDESLGCGGMIAEACMRGVPPVVVVLTDGSGSHPNSRTYDAHRLRRLREREALDATAHLGLAPERVAFLRYPDTAAPAVGPEMTAAAQRLAELIDGWGCRCVAVSWQHDPHCDHEAAAAIAVLACVLTGARLVAYPVWGWTLPAGTAIDSDHIGGFRIDVTRHMGRKRAAILAHRSQYAGIIADDPDGFQMPRAFMERFLTGTEVFIDMEPGG